jgi:hypothetical protein
MTTNSLQRHMHKGRLSASVICGAATVFLLLAISLVPTPANALTTLSQGFKTSQSIPFGSMVSLDDNTSDQVSATTTKNVNSMLGVVISDGNSLLSLSNGQGSQVQIATSGIAQVLVSDINGNIEQGDEITASPITGIGMKATDSIKVIGIAQEGLSANNATRQSYTDKGGKKHEVKIGQVPVLINIAYFYKQPSKTLIPSAVQNISNALAGKTVNAAPILVCMGIFIITLIIVVSIIYSMIRSSIISVGRNPMSQSAIYRDMLQLSALVVAILGVAMVSIYMILKRF